MSDSSTSAAERVESLMPVVMRRLFPYMPEDPMADMPLGQLRMLRLISDGHRSLSEISQITGHTPSAVTQMINRLEATGMVCRVEDPGDRRHRWVELSEEGDQMVRCRKGLRVRSAEQALSKLAPHDQEEFLRLLETLAASASDERLNRELESISG